jgi:hypothetical protein
MTNDSANTNISQSDAVLADAYDVPIAVMNAEVTDNLKTIDKFVQEDIPKLLQKMNDFHADAMLILDKQLSAQNVQKLKAKDNAQDAPDIHDTTENTLLQDTKILFNKHVTSVFAETKKDLLHAPMLAKLGTTLSLPGRALSGVSNFWEGLIEKRPFLKVLDAVIVKPLEIGLLIKFWPEVAIIKASELVGRACCAYAKAPKGQRWSAVKAAASEMLRSTFNHSVSIAGSLVQAKVIDKINVAASLSDMQKTMLSEYVKSNSGMSILENLGKDPKMTAAIMVGATESSKILGIDLKDSMKVVSDILSSKSKDISIKALCEDEAMQAAAPLLQKVFAISKGVLSQTPRTFKSVINSVQDSKKITDEEKHTIIKEMTQLMVNKVSVAKSQDVKSNKSKGWSSRLHASLATGKDRQASV